MDKFVSMTALAVACTVGLTACSKENSAQTEPARVLVTIADKPQVTETRCFMRVQLGDEKPILVDFRKPTQGTGSLMSTVRNFELCSNARTGDRVVLDSSLVR